MEKLFITIFVLLLLADNAVAAKKKELYVPMDYSTCGYCASECEIPDVPNVIFVGAGNGDCYAELQRAIDYVGGLKADKHGFRGAVLLGEGTYNISSPLRITVSGVVLRGQGTGKTIVRKTGADRGAVIYIQGTGTKTYGDSTEIGRAHV